MIKAFSICMLIWFSFTNQPVYGQAGTIRTLQNKLTGISDSLQYVDAVNRIALLMYEQNIDSSLYYSVRARGIAQRLDYTKGIADANNNFGIVFDIKGNIQLALRYYNDAYNQYVSLGDSSNIVQTLMNIGAVYNVSGKDRKAVGNLKQALLLGNQISHDSITAIVIYNYLLMYPDSFPQDIKSRYFDKAAGIARKYSDKPMQLALYQLKADNYIANQERKKGIDLLKQTLAQTLNMKLFYLSMDLLIDLGDQYLNTDTQIALDYYLHAMTIAEEKGYRMYAIELAKKLSGFYSGKNNVDMAYFYDQKLIRLYQQQMELDKVSGIDYIDLAIRDQQLTYERVRSAYNYKLLWLATVICFLTILSIAILYRNWKLTSKTHDVLKTQFGQLESATQALALSNENYARIIKVVAHDLRNPIGAISSLSSVLLEDHSFPEPTGELIQAIQSSADSSIKLIGDLLNTDFDLKEGELNKQPVELTLLLQQAVQLLAYPAKEKGQQLTLATDGKTQVHIDQDKFLRVFNNIVMNAIKFSPREGEIKIRMKHSQQGILITVQDNGIGIPAEFSSKIFDPFTSAKRAGTAGEKPFGLGLYISKQIIEAHQGRIWFESRPAEGARFFILLPAE